MVKGGKGIEHFWDTLVLFEMLGESIKHDICIRSADLNSRRLRKRKVPGRDAESAGFLGCLQDVFALAFRF